MNRKIIAAFLAFIFIFGVFPMETVYANPQNPVKVLTIIDSNISQNNPGSVYNIKINWKQPDVAAGTGTDPAHQGKSISYDVMYSNATTGEAYSLIKTVAGEEGADQSLTLNNFQLAKGSIYKFKAEPWHIHTIEGQNGGTTQAVRITPTLKSQEALYLTDIRVSAEGSGNMLTVKWDNPTLDGEDIFNGYNIYYRPRGATKFGNPVRVETKAVKIPGKPNELQYTITDNGLQVGTFYDVAVEPTIDNMEVRGGDSNTPITQYKSYYLAYTSQRNRYYMTTEAKIKILLRAEEVGSEVVRLFWSSLSNNVSGGLSMYPKTIEVFEQTDGAPRAESVGILQGDFARNTNFWYVKRPKAITEYYLVVTYDYIDPVTGKNATLDSEKAAFNPTFNDFSPYRPKITSISDNGIIPLKIDVDWLAFTRKPYNEAEEKAAVAEDIYIDKNVSYDIWVTDNLTFMDDPTFIALKKITTAEGVNMTVDEKVDELTGNKFYVFSTKTNTSIVLDKYVTRTRLPDGTNTPYEVKPLEENKVYYVRIQATRSSAGSQTSQPSTSSIYIPPLGSIPVNPVMLSSPPLRVKEDGVKVEGGVATIDIEWESRWFEAYDPQTATWHSKVGFDANKKLVFGNVKMEEVVLPVALSEIEGGVNVERIKTQLAQKLGATVPIRYLDLTGASYRLHVAQYDYISQFKDNSYKGYVNSINSNPNAWSGITFGNIAQPLFEYTITTENVPQAGPLKLNTAYVIFLQPIVGTTAAYFPSYVYATTSNVLPPLVIIPTVPNLEDASKVAVTNATGTEGGVEMNEPTTDGTATVRWEFSTDLNYEIAYSDKLTDYPDSGKLIPVTKQNITTRQDPKTKVDYYYMTIRDLFPNTQYYVWIRSKAGNINSAWSNVVYTSTKDITKPFPPNGLGVVSKESLNTYNKEKSTTYTPVNSDYFILEWVRNAQDKEVPTSPGTATGGTATGLLSNLIPNSYLGMFSELTPNKTYYARAKTIYTVSLGGGNAAGGIKRTYNYVVQISLTKDFAEVIELTIPVLEQFQEGASNFRRLESDWSSVINVITGKTDSEYDGDKDERAYPLPIEDYEITFDYTTNTLVYRFRSDKKDASGNKDNGVDARFISNLVKNKTMVYTLDLSKYQSITPVNRIVELPYSIFNALDERKISLQVKADNLKYTLHPGSIYTSEIKQINDVGKNAIVKLSFSTYSPDTPSLYAGEVYSSKPHKIAMQLTTPTRNVNIENLAKDAKVELAVNYEAVKNNANTATYLANKNTAGWERVNSDYNSASNSMIVNTKKLASYGIITKNTPKGIIDDEYRGAIDNVMSKIAITDAASFDTEAPVNASRFNKIISALATNKKEIAMNAPLTDSEFKSLGKSGILVSGSQVSKEAGINSLVKLYELKNSPVKNYPNDSPKTVGCEPKYKSGLLKAEKLGFLDGYNNTFDPKELLTTGEMFKFLNYIIEDAGL